MALSIDDLRSFILVCTERSVTKAADQLGVSQQSVSERIRRLERRIGAPLFDRLPFGMRLSAAGYRFFPYATQCVQLIDQALDAVGDDELVRIEVQSAVATAVMPLLEDLAATEQVKITLTDATDTDAMVAALTGGLIDVGIGSFKGLQSPPSLPPTRSRRARRSRREELERLGPHAPTLKSQQESSEQSEAEGARTSTVADTDLRLLEVVAEALVSDPVIWAAPPEHPLVQRSEPISISELIAALPAGAGLDGATTPDPTRRNEDLVVAARSLLTSDLAAGRLVELPLDQPSWVVPISIAYRAVEQDRPAIDNVRTALLEGNARSLAGDNGLPPGGASPNQ